MDVHIRAANAARLYTQKHLIVTHTGHGVIGIYTDITFAMENSSFHILFLRFKKRDPLKRIALMNRLSLPLS